MPEPTEPQPTPMPSPTEAPDPNQAISQVIAPGVTMPARQITEWPVPSNQTVDQATEMAFQGQVAREANTQPGVSVMKVETQPTQSPRKDGLLAAIRRRLGH
jgi:hypothetical protein